MSRYICFKLSQFWIRGVDGEEGFITQIMWMHSGGTVASGQR